MRRLRLIQGDVEPIDPTKINPDFRITNDQYVAFIKSDTVVDRTSRKYHLPLGHIALRADKMDEAFDKETRLK